MVHLQGDAPRLQSSTSAGGEHGDDAAYARTASSLIVAGSICRNLAPREGFFEQGVVNQRRQLSARTCHAIALLRYPALFFFHHVQHVPDHGACIPQLGPAPSDELRCEVDLTGNIGPEFPWTAAKPFGGLDERAHQ